MGRLLAGGPLAFGKHGAGLFAGGGVDQVVAEEDLRGCCAGSAVLGDVVGADVDCRCGRGGDHLDGHGLAMSAGDAVGLAFGGLNDELEIGYVGRDAGHSEGKGLTLTGDGRGAGVLDTDECRGIADGGAAASDDPVVEPGVQVTAGDLGFGAEDGTSLLREGELVLGEDLVFRKDLPLGGELLEDTFDLGLVSSTDRAAVSAVADVLPALHLSGRNALGAAADLLEGYGRNILHGKWIRGTAASGRLWPPGAVVDEPARVCGRLVRSQSLDLIPFYRAERPQVSDRNARRGGKSLAVELP